MKPLRHAIAYAIYHPDRTQILLVQRPFDDPNLPGVWGLPAGGVYDHETFEEAVHRSGLEKLGVELAIASFIRRGAIERADYVLNMEEFEVVIRRGEPSVPQPFPAVTQYAAWKWGLPDELQDAASKGSLCSRLFLFSQPVG